MLVFQLRPFLLKGARNKTLQSKAKQMLPNARRCGRPPPKQPRRYPRGSMAVQRRCAQQYWNRKDPKGSVGGDTSISSRPRTETVPAVGRDRATPGEGVQRGRWGDPPYLMSPRMAMVSPRASPCARAGCSLPVPSVSSTTERQPMKMKSALPSSSATQGWT